MVNEGLIVKKEWLDLILSGKKTWEIRGSNTHKRGKIALIESGSKHIKGYVELIDSRPISLNEYQLSETYHGVDALSKRELPYKRTYAWVLKNPEQTNPIPYNHPRGAIIWVKLNK